MNPPLSRRTFLAGSAAAAGLVVAGARSAAAEPVEIMPGDPLEAFNQFKGDPAPQAEIVAVSGNPEFDRALQITTTASPASAGLDGEYEFTLGAEIAVAVSANDAAVATFWARSITPPAWAQQVAHRRKRPGDDSHHDITQHGKGERARSGDAGYATFAFERDGGSFKKSAVAALRLTSTWQKFEFPFRIAEDYAPGDAHFQLWLGYGPQVLEIAGVSVRDWGPGDPAGYPTVTYAGRDPDAAWRAAAAQRIDQYRKGDLTVTVVDPSGEPVSGAQVHVGMQRHAFNFGTAVDGATLMQGATDGQTYRQIVTQSDMFNQTTFGNNLKWRSWENETERETITKPALKWLREHGMTFRGHNLIWPSWGHLPSDLQDLQNDKPALRERIDNHLTDEAGELTGSIDAWDVVNEPYSDHNLQDIFGPDEINRWYVLAKQADPRARLVLNDYDLIADNGWNKRHQDYFYNLVKRIKDGGYPIEGIGLESHFTGLQPTPPAEIYRLLNHYAELGLPMEATEFDIVTTDEQLQADYTRDFLTIMFSHPDVTAVSTFGIWEKNIWNSLAALFRTDWSIKPNGQVWQDLVTEQWWTDVSGQTDGLGAYTARGFLGDYVVTVSAHGAAEKVHVTMDSRSGATMTVVADGTNSDNANLLLNGDAELGNANWYGFSPSTVRPDTSIAHTGKVSMRSTGRTASWQGPAEGVQVAAGQSYTSDAWVRLVSGSSTTAHIKIKLWFTDGTTESVPLASGTVATGGWTQLQTPAPVPLDVSKTLDHAEWWISTTSGTGDLLVDDASLRNGA